MSDVEGLYNSAKLSPAIQEEVKLEEHFIQQDCEQAVFDAMSGAIRVFERLTTVAYRATDSDYIALARLLLEERDRRFRRVKDYENA